MASLVHDHFFAFMLVALLTGCSNCQAGEPRKQDGSSESGGGESGEGGAVAQCEDGWCRIPAGTFTMGSPENEFGHPAVAEDQVEVTLTHSFVIQQHETTQAEWTALSLPNPSGQHEDGTGDCLASECPVGNVTWFEVAAFANLLSEEHELAPCFELNACLGRLGEGLVCEGASLTAPTIYECEGYRMPTEAEWEYSARAGTSTAFYSGPIKPLSSISVCAADPNLQRIAWYCYNSDGTTHPVEQKAPNDFGLFDMSGNASEWVFDHAVAHYDEGPLINPRGTLVHNDSRRRRGGGYNAKNEMCRSADRLLAPWYASGRGLGFRLVRTLKERRSGKG